MSATALKYEDVPNSSELRIRPVHGWAATRLSEPERLFFSLKLGHDTNATTREGARAASDVSLRSALIDLDELRDSSGRAEIVCAYTALAEESFRKVWDNEEDAIYDTL